MESTAIHSGLNHRVSQQYRAGFDYRESHRERPGQNASSALAIDRVTLSYRTESVTTYDSSMMLKGVAPDGFELLRGLVIDIFKDQGYSLEIPTGNTEPGMETLSLEEITPEEAAQLVSDDGYFGVEQTSDRIVDFAIGISGGDPARIDAIKAGVEKGFNEAKAMFGDWLPEISYNTYDRVMEKLDAWVEETASYQA